MQIHITVLPPLSKTKVTKFLLDSGNRAKGNRVRIQHQMLLQHRPGIHVQSFLIFKLFRHERIQHTKIEKLKASLFF